MDKVISLAVSAAAVGFILWWFFGKRSAPAGVAVEADGIQQIEITVDGGYQPQVVQLKAGIPAQLIFHRKDPSACLEQVLMPDFGISQMLPVGDRVTVKIDAPSAGEYKY